MTHNITLPNKSKIPPKREIMTRAPTTNQSQQAKAEGGKRELKLIYLAIKCNMLMSP